MQYRSLGRAGTKAAPFALGALTSATIHIAESRLAVRNFSASGSADRSLTRTSRRLP
jgi:hypothetical protein